MKAHPAGFQPVPDLPITVAQGPRWVLWGAMLALPFFTIACGPRHTPVAAPDLGSPPAIISLDSTFPDPPIRLEAAQVTFPVAYRIHALDADANMSAVAIEVRYTDCNGDGQKVELTSLITAPDNALREVFLVGQTADRVRVPAACYAADNRFALIGRIRDFRGNLSNAHTDQLQISPNLIPGTTPP